MQTTLSPMLRRAATAPLLGLFAIAAPLAAQTRFADGEFDPANWTFVELDRNEGGSVATEVIPDGNPGAALRVSTTINAAAGVSQITGVWLWHQVYDPAISGGFASIDYAEDARAVDTIGSGQATGLAIRQNDSIYIKRVGFTSEFDWTHKQESGIVPTEFGRVSGSASGPPDFSASGAPIEVGFYRAQSHPTSGGGMGTRVVDIDNWSATLRPPCVTDGDCADPSACATGTCVAGVCEGISGGCDDGVLCTVDQCVAGACENVLATDFSTVDGLLGTLVARVESSPCGSEEVVKRTVRKLKKRLKKARARLMRADRATREARILKQIDKAQKLLGKARALVATAVDAGLISSGCGAELTALIAEVESCTRGLPLPLARRP
jgi:hypothetical protein